MARYTRQILRQMPSTLFVFGDNLARVGYGGQAAEARGELNAIGIVTKMSPQTYLNDGNFDDVMEPIVKAFVILADHIRKGGDIVWPLDGVGTGLARLNETAPVIFEAIENCRNALFSMADKVIVRT